MNNDLTKPFLPTLTVMVDYGNAPFLWLVDRPDQGGVGGNLCDGTWWHESVPMSEELWKRFAGWAIEFDRTRFDADNGEPDGWDWIAFHARGLKLARSLKDEVGDAYRVVYEKPCEDPNYRIDERTEILANGELVPLPPFRNSLVEPLRFCECIVSGGQTGADRGALDFAIRHGYTHGGWAPGLSHSNDMHLLKISRKVFHVQQVMQPSCGPSRKRVYFRFLGEKDAWSGSQSDGETQ